MNITMCWWTESSKVHLLKFYCCKTEVFSPKRLTIYHLDSSSMWNGAFFVYSRDQREWMMLQFITCHIFSLVLWLLLKSLNWFENFFRYSSLVIRVKNIFTFFKGALTFALSHIVCGNTPFTYIQVLLQYFYYE